MSEIDVLGLIGQLGFPIAVALYLLYERTKTFKEQRAQMVSMNTMLLEVVKANTVAQTELRVTIQKLCELVNGNQKADNQGMPRSNSG